MIALPCLDQLVAVSEQNKAVVNDAQILREALVDAVEAEDLRRLEIRAGVEVPLRLAQPEAGFENSWNRARAGLRTASHERLNHVPLEGEVCRSSVSSEYVQ